MKKLKARHKLDIKFLLYSGHVLGVKDHQYKGFGGYQLWWYSKERNVCTLCESHWSDTRIRVSHCSLDRAARILWGRRKLLYVGLQHSGQYRELATLADHENLAGSGSNYTIVPLAANTQYV